MAPILSIVIPHKRTEKNNKSLDINIQMLLENTHNEFELIVDTETPKCPYRIWNESAIMARGDILVFSNSDVLMAPGWDVPLVTHIQDNTIMTGYLVEAGNIPVASVNIHRNFGNDPDSFDRGGFEGYANQAAQLQDSVKEERGWYMPCAFYRNWFIWTGGFDIANTFPYPNDIYFWKRCTEQLGTKLLRVNSYAYHFQNLSGR